jgi:hypothetical protein
MLNPCPYMLRLSDPGPAIIPSCAPSVSATFRM